MSVRSTSRRRVVLTLSADSVVVEGHRRGRRVRERFDLEHAGDAAVRLRQVLRTSRMLQAGGRCDLRIVWDPARLLVRMSTVQQGGLSDLDPDSLAVRVALDTGGGSGLDVVVRRQEVDDIAAALGSARIEGRASLDIGLLARTRRAVRSASDAIAGRSGLVIDVTAETVCVLRLRGGSVLDVRCAARTDVGAQVASMIAALTTSSPADSEVVGEDSPGDASRPWFWLDVPAAEVEGLRHACRATLRAGAAADLAIARADASARSSERRR